MIRSLPNHSFYLGGDMNNSEKKGKLALYTILEVVGLFALMLLGGMFDFLNFGFSFDKITTAEYWNDVTIQGAMYSIALMLGIFGTLEKQELKNQEYFSDLGIYRGLLKHKKQSFTPYIDEVLNPYIKREAMKERACRRLYRLDKHAKDEFKISYRDCKNMTKEEFRDFKPQTPRKIINVFGRIFKGMEYNDKFKYSWRCKRYCAKRRRLERLASDEYINENWETASVRYHRVNANAFTYSVRIGDSKLSEYQVENKSGRDITLAMLQKFLWVVIVGIFIGSIIWDASVNQLLEDANGWIACLVKYFIRVIMIFANFFVGTTTGRKVFYNNFIWVLLNRIRILKEYIDWRKKNNDMDSYADKLIEAYENNITAKEQAEKAKADLAEAVKAVENKTK